MHYLPAPDPQRTRRDTAAFPAAKLGIFKTILTIRTRSYPISRIAYIVLLELYLSGHFTASL